MKRFHLDPNNEDYMNKNFGCGKLYAIPSHAFRSEMFLNIWEV